MRVLVNVRMKDKEIDIELPSDLDIKSLIEIASKALDRDSTGIKQIHVLEERKILNLTQKLSDVYLADGMTIYIGER